MVDTGRLFLWSTMHDINVVERGTAWSYSTVLKVLIKDRVRDRSAFERTVCCAMCRYVYMCTRGTRDVLVAERRNS